MPPLKLPIIDPLGIISEPASKLASKFVDDIEFNDPVRDLVVDILDDDDDAINEAEKNIPAGSEFTPTPAGPISQPPPRSAQRSEYFQMGDRVMGDSFTCERNRAVAERVARRFAPDNHRLRLECMHNIREFTMYPETSEQYRRAKQWLEQHNLKDELRQAYIEGL